MTKARSLGITEFPYMEFDSNGKRTDYENEKGYWVIREYNSQGKCIYCENTKKAGGYYEKWRKEYDERGNETYYEDLGRHPHWHRSEYNSQGKRISFTNSDGIWWKREYDENGNFLSEKNSWIK